MPAADEGVAALRLVVRGRVQGVWFRAWTVKTARSLGLDGWVRNRADGNVEILAAGPASALDALVAACRQGPPMAHVDEIERRPAVWDGVRGFGQTPDE